MLPTRMTAVAIRAPGGPEVLSPEERPVPEPGADEILVRVEAAGVNRPDVLQREGKYPPPKGASDIPGLEISGEVVARGTHALRHAVGAQVTALVPGGGYAEYCIAKETSALPVPRGFTMVEAAAIPETYFTVWPNMFERGRLVAGETVLVHGGGSGIGTTAIQLAKAFGARVIVTAGSAEKCAACVKLGADAAINYRETDFVAEVKRLTGDLGAHLVLDIVGGDYVARNYEAAADDGRIVQLALQAGPPEKLNLQRLMAKRLTHTGSTLRPRPFAFKAAVAAALRENVWPLFEARKIAPVIDRTFPLAEAAAAHRRLESSEHFGKVVLTVG
ncbi:MAG TPA: NAD(P)H-quinone oxidoreductase [Bauldia sp.]|nr:NAD(P)H-quinone oxidoreductase [Bauldia sp.]